MAKSSTSFKKGHQHSKEALEKMRLANIGRIVSDETRQKLRDACLRNGNRPPSAKGVKRRPETIEKLRKYLTGRKRPEISGKNCYNWKGGITPINVAIRMSLEYKSWRKSVFERDNYTCVWCKIKGGNLQADHIKPFSLFPELRFDIDNGRTLCKPCHLKTDTWGGRVNVV
jgi:5-methylcytosine-specific restriction endonuclease McrA